MNSYSDLGDAVGSSLEILEEDDSTNYNSHGLAVIGRFFSINYDDDAEENVAFTHLLEVIEEILNPGQESNHTQDLNIVDFLVGVFEGEDAHHLEPGEVESVTLYDYFSYYGGLTTPGCYEIVAWHVLVNPLEITWAQYERFDELFDCHDEPISGNWRAPVVNDNDIYSHCGVTADDPEGEEEFDYACTSVSRVDGDEDDDASGAIWYGGEDKLWVKLVGIFGFLWVYFYGN